MTDSPPADPPPLTDIRKLVAPLRQKANRIRRRHNATEPDAELTVALLTALERLLDTPTPPGAIKYDEGDHLAVHLLWQVRAMDAIFGRRHWRWIVHHDNDQTACAHVVIGNNLRRVRVDLTTDELIEPTEADVLLAYQGTGAVGLLETRGATFKGARTSALRGLLSLIGPGGDITMLHRHYPRNPAASPAAGPLATPARTLALAPPLRGGDEDAAAQHSPAGAERQHEGTGEPAAAEPQTLRASPLLLREIRLLAREKEIPATQLVAMIEQVRGLDHLPVGEQEAEQTVAILLNERIPRLGEQEAVTLRALVEQAEPHLPIIAAASPPSSPATGDAEAA